MSTTEKQPPRPGTTPSGESLHSDFYRNLREKITSWADRKEIDPSYRDYLLLVPDLFHFLTMLVMEPRVAMRDKAWLGVAVAYVLSPFDLLPDAFFPLGLIDDLIVMVVVLDSVLGNVPRSLIQKHWAGSGDIFTVVREALQKADSWIGKGMFRRLKSYLAKQGLWPEDEGVAVPPPVPAAGAPVARSKTPSRGRAGKKSATTGAKTSAPKTSAPKTSAPKKASSKKTTAKKAASRRTIGAKKPSGPKS